MFRRHLNPALEMSTKLPTAQFFSIYFNILIISGTQASRRFLSRRSPYAARSVNRNEPFGSIIKHKRTLRA
jgi:hypothetical protein